MVERAATLQGVDDVAGLRARELGDQLARRALEGAADGEDGRVFQHRLLPFHGSRDQTAGMAKNAPPLHSPRPLPSSTASSTRS